MRKAGYLLCALYMHPPPLILQKGRMRRLFGGEVFLHEVHFVL